MLAEDVVSILPELCDEAIGLREQLRVSQLFRKLVDLGIETSGSPANSDFSVSSNFFGKLVDRAGIETGREPSGIERYL